MAKKKYVQEESEDSSRIVKEILITFVVIIAFLFIFSMFFSADKNEVVEISDGTCGDGSINGTCSERKPFFCSNDKLVEMSSLCGCPKNSNVQDEICVSKFQNQPNNLTLKYILRGEENEINYTAYYGLVKYMNELPLFISSNQNQKPSRADFKLRNLNNEEQKFLLSPLVAKIQNIGKNGEDQVRIAVSIVQNIPWGISNNVDEFRGVVLNHSRASYEVLYDEEGICGEKSELLAFLLRDLGYGVALFYNQEENHESIGIKCPVEKSWRNSGYCFVETSGPAIISDISIPYANGLSLKSEPQVFVLSEGNSLGEDLYEYEDAEKIMDIRKSANGKGFFFNPWKFFELKKLEKKYGLAKRYEAG